MATTAHKYTLIAKIDGEIPYDVTDPASYTAALEKVAEQRKALLAAGAEIVTDRGAPVRRK